MNTELISVIIPAYNAEKSIERAIRSVLSQDFNEWNLIVVDDGSKDSTASIAQSFASEDSRIIVIHQENGGEMAARAAGIRQANAEWLYFLDADDAIKRDTLSSIYSHISDDIDVVIFEFPLNGIISRNRYYCELLSFNSWWLCGKLWRRELFDEYAMSVPRYFRTGGDMLTQMRLLKNLKRNVLGVPEYKYIYDDDNPLSVRRTTYKDYEYEKRMILEVGQALDGIDEGIIDSYRHWQLTYLSGMMGLRYDINYSDNWISDLKIWSETADISLREKLAVRAIDKAPLRSLFVLEKFSKRVARSIFNQIKNVLGK